MMKYLLPLIALSVGFFSTPSSAETVQFLALKAKDTHQASEVWSGRFTAPNGKVFDVTDYYRNEGLEFSVSGVLAFGPDQRVSWLVPVIVDGGYDAPLYQAAPSLALGIGMALVSAPNAVFTWQVENMVKLGGRVRERACYDIYQRAFHCGTGLAWSDYQSSSLRRRDDENVPRLKLRYLYRF
jgi:hypothetical protein